jgi:tRNA dimethylallyltransferase
VTRHLVLVGATATGKSAVALELARRRAPDVELVSADSMQVYRGMDIGTAKPTRAVRDEIPHHLLDLVEPWEDYSVARFQRDAMAALADIERRERSAVVVGGTGLYVQALVDGLDIPGRWPEVRAELEASDEPTNRLHERLRVLDPVAAARIEPGNRRRIVRALEVTLGSGRPFSTFGPGLDSYPVRATERFHLVGLRVDRATQAAGIERRFRAMLDAGLLDEVRRLADPADRPLSRTARQALGYKELLRHLEEGAPLEACIEEAVRRTRLFAKRQEAWFRRDPRITWYDAGEGSGNPVALADRVLGDWEDRCRPPNTTA